jgi:5'-nucleotidase
MKEEISRAKYIMTNDDSYKANHLNELFRMMTDKYGKDDVVCVAPDQNCTMGSHVVNINQDIELTNVYGNFYKATTTPAGCVYLALGLTDRSRDKVIISGPNHGCNLGEDRYYSGTLAATREAAFTGYPALAISYEGSTEHMTPQALKLCMYMIDHVSRQFKKYDEQAREAVGTDLKVPWYLSLNIPQGYDGSKPVSNCVAGRRDYKRAVVKISDGVYQIGSPSGIGHHDSYEGCDLTTVAKGQPTLTLFIPDLSSVVPKG